MHHVASFAHGPNLALEFVGWNEEWHTSGQYPVTPSTIWDSLIHV
jgi:hypothetical protein